MVGRTSPILVVLATSCDLTVGFAILSSIGTGVLLDRVSQRVRGVVSVGLALLIPFSLWLQGDRPFHANHTPIEHPVEEYTLVLTWKGTGWSCIRLIRKLRILNCLCCFS